MLGFTKSAAILALTSVFLTNASQGAQISALGYVSPATATSSSGNNFTMLDPAGNFVGGSNAVNMTWDGTVFTSSSDYTGPGSVSNMSLSSSVGFIGFAWTAHDIQVFRPGSYTFDTALGGGNLESGVQTLNICSSCLGVHLLFDWAGNLNIDVSVVWAGPAPFGTTAGQQTLTGNAIWDLASIDGDGIGGPGIQMAAGGPFAGYAMNFNLKGMQVAPVPLPASIWFLGSGIVAMLGWMRREKFTR